MLKLERGHVAVMHAMALVIALSCGGSKEPTASDPESGASGSSLADVVSVTASGDSDAFTFSVAIESPDTGCDQYANWWEVISADGNLVYRRILAHSHVDEQPFTRSGGPVEVAGDQPLIIRAHLDRGGEGAYGGVEFVGTVANGFTRSTETANAASGVETASPQPSGCAF